MIFITIWLLFWSPKFDWLILTPRQHASGYLMPRSKTIMFIVRSYLYFCIVSLEVFVFVFCTQSYRIRTISSISIWSRDEHRLIEPLQDRVDLRVITIKGYFTLNWSPEPEPHQRHIKDTLFERSYPLQGIVYVF